MLAIIAVLIFCFALRALPAIFKISPSGSDQYYHLFMGDYIRKNHFKYPEKTKGFLLPGKYIYPPLYHYILALFPRLLREKTGLYLGAIIDTIHAFALYLFVIYISKIPEISVFLPNPQAYAVLACLLFSISPALLAIGVGPRTYSVTPRPLGELLFTLTFLFALIFYINGDLFSLIISSFFASLIFLSSKFGVQVLLFFSVIVTILTGFYLLLLVPLLGIAIGLVISKGHLASVLQGSFQHLSLYKNIIQKTYSCTLSRNNFPEFKYIIISLLNRNLKEFARHFRNVLSHNTFIILILRNPFFFLILYIYIFLNPLLGNNVIYFLNCWIIASIVVFVATSLKPLLFLGEAERYLEYSIAPQILLLVIFLNYWTGCLQFIVIYCMAFYGLTITELALHKKYSKLDSKEHLISWIKENIHKKNLLKIAADGMQFELLYRTDNPVWYPESITLSKEEFLKIYPVKAFYPPENIQSVIEQYDIKYVITSKNDLIKAEKSGIHYKFKNLDTVFDNPEYLVYKTK
jgi:hypothetical protein